VAGMRPERIDFGFQTRRAGIGLEDSKPQRKDAHASDHDST
jgi:hypothetical protein